MPWLRGLKHSPPLHATHLSKIVGGLSFEWPLSATNKIVDKRNVLAASLIFLSLRSARGRFSVSRAIILHSTNRAWSPEAVNIKNCLGI